MRLELRERDFESFFAAPFNAYGAESHYVSPLKSDFSRALDDRRNPLFSRFGTGTWFSVLRDGIPVGRIVAHIHRASNERHNLSRSYFGYFDCIDDAKVAGLLLRTAEDWGRAQGADEIAGNFNLTAMQQMGVVTEGFENPPYLDQVYNPPHIPRLLEQHGYRRFFPMSTFEIPLARWQPNERETRFPSAEGWRWERLRLWRFRKLMRATRDVLNDGFTDNPLFVPPTEDEFMFQAGEMMWVIDQRIAPIVFKDGRPVGVVVCVPDLNPFLKRVRSRFGWHFPFHYARHFFGRKRAAVIFYSVIRACHGQGLMTAMLSDTLNALKQAGYEQLGISWIGDGNPASLRQMERYGAKRMHRTHLFGKPLNETG